MNNPTHLSKFKIFFLSISFFLYLSFVYLFSSPSVDFISPRELSIGINLTGKTRMANNVMTSFDMVVLSVIKGRRPKEDTIMAQIKTPLFEETGVLAGMSGSPVYYQDKLVGAVAFTRTFMKKPIVGITPIELMLEVIDYSKKETDYPYFDASRIYGLEPISTPIGVSSSFFLTENIIQKVLNRDDLIIVPMGAPLGTGEIEKIGGNNHHRDEDEKPTFQAGDGVAISLVSGDMSISVMGTVTYISNDYVLAFGHPFGLFGKVNFPLHQAKVDAVIPMQTLSFKIGSLGREVGALVEDRSPAVLGLVGKKSPKIPFHLTFKSSLQEKKFTYSVTADKNYFSSMVALLTLNSLIYFESISEEKSFSYDLNIKTDYQNKSIRIIDEITAEQTQNGMIAIARHLKGLIGHIENNRFLSVGVEGIELSIALQPGIDYHYLVDVMPNKISYQPGEKVHLLVKFENYRQGILKKKITFNLPKHLTAGRYPVMVSSGAYFLSLDAALNKSKYVPRHPDRLFEILNNKINNKTLSIFMFDPGANFLVKGKAYQKLPQFMADSLAKSRTGDKSVLFDFYREDVEMPSVVAGQVVVNLNIKENVYRTK